MKLKEIQWFDFRERKICTGSRFYGALQGGGVVMVGAALAAHSVGGVLLGLFAIYGADLMRRSRPLSGDAALTIEGARETLARAQEAYEKAMELSREGGGDEPG